MRTKEKDGKRYIVDLGDVQMWHRRGITNSSPDINVGPPILKIPTTQPAGNPMMRWMQGSLEKGGKWWRYPITHGKRWLPSYPKSPKRSHLKIISGLRIQEQNSSCPTSLPRSLSTEQTLFPPSALNSKYKARAILLAPRARYEASNHTCLYTRLKMNRKADNKTPTSNIPIRGNTYLDLAICKIRQRSC
jgi:hypothetical protein